MSLSRTFSNAAKAIEQGWVQRVPRKWDKEAKAERVCLTTALAEASKREGTSYHAAFERLWQEVGMHPEAWNDQRARTKKEVIATLRRLAKTT